MFVDRTWPIRLHLSGFVAKTDSAPGETLVVKDVSHYQNILIESSPNSYHADDLVRNSFDICIYSYFYTPPHLKCLLLNILVNYKGSSYLCIQRHIQWLAIVCLIMHSKFSRFIVKLELMRLMIYFMFARIISRIACNNSSPCLSQGRAYPTNHLNWIFLYNTLVIYTKVSCLIGAISTY